MKALLAILLITTLQITLKCDNDFEDSKIMRAYPKKVRTPVQRSIQIINAKKFEKLGTLESRKANIKKAFVRKNVYTVFPPISEKKIYDIPESFHYQGEINRKPRVKKVLPEYGLSVFRRKRSADNYLNSTGVSETVEVNKNVVKRRRNRRIKSIRHGRNIARNSTSIRSKKYMSRNKPIIGVEAPKHVIEKLKYRKKNTTKSENLMHGKKRYPVNLKYTMKHKNETKLLHPNEKPIGPKQGDARKKKSKRERKLKKEQQKKVRNRRLIAGRDAMIQDYPYVVSIQKDKKHWCSGALLNPRLVITTANCVWKAKRVSRMRIRAGSRYMERGGQVVKIQEVMKHPKWSIRSLPDNDVALLLLDRNIKFSDSVHGVDLPNRAMLPAFEDVWVTSWGAERRDGIFQTVGVALQVYHAMVMDHDKCNNITQRFGVAVSRNFICVAQTGRRAPCTRDTGAPAVSDGILWGLASWGIRKLCGTERFPAMFSYLASRSNLDFITNATLYLMSDKRYYPYGDRFIVNKAVTTSTTGTTTFF